MIMVGNEYQVNGCMFTVLPRLLILSYYTDPSVHACSMSN